MWTNKRSDVLAFDAGDGEQESADVLDPCKGRLSDARIGRMGDQQMGTQRAQVSK
jgi:hypothetical protein